MQKRFYFKTKDLDGKRPSILIEYNTEEDIEKILSELELKYEDLIEEKNIN